MIALNTWKARREILTQKLTTEGKKVRVMQDADSSRDLLGLWRKTCKESCQSGEREKESGREWEPARWGQTMEETRSKVREWSQPSSQPVCQSHSSVSWRSSRTRRRRNRRKDGGAGGAGLCVHRSVFMLLFQQSFCFCVTMQGTTSQHCVGPLQTKNNLTPRRNLSVVYSSFLFTGDTALQAGVRFSDNSWCAVLRVGPD